MASTRKLTAEEQAALDAVRDLPDSDIDLTDPDAPEVTDWSGAVRGLLFKPIKKPIALRLDADVLAWFKEQGDGYQTRINAVLRDYMQRQQRHG
ncbi:MAG: BrnA antitoxin family protein [Azospirillaceae bacterium]|nr:BrnA antitoxin family protein [Azospirillaceae bacterium]